MVNKLSSRLESLKNLIDRYSTYEERSIKIDALHSMKNIVDTMVYVTEDKDKTHNEDVLKGLKDCALCGCKLSSFLIMEGGMEAVRVVCTNSDCPFMISEFSSSDDTLFTKGELEGMVIKLNRRHIDDKG